MKKIRFVESNFGSIIYGGCKVYSPFIFLYKKGHNLNQILDKINLNKHKEMRF